MGTKAARTVSAGTRTHSVTVPPSKGPTKLGAAIKGLSARASVADLARLAVDVAKREAQAAGVKAGLSGSALRGSIARARADAIKAAAKKADTSPTTVRRWVNGTQAPSPKASGSREKFVRSLGGARAVQAAQIRATRTMYVGTIHIDPYPADSPHVTREINKTLTMDPTVMSAVAAHVEAGRDDEAMTALSEAILNAWDPGLGDVLTINDIPGSIIWG